MTETEAQSLGQYALRLFPVTTAERITSLAAVLLSFPDQAFAEAALLKHSQETEKLSIPSLKSTLDTEQHRRQYAAIADERYRNRLLSADKIKHYAERDKLLAGFSDAELRELQLDVAERITFETAGARDLFRKCKVTNGWVREEIFKYVTSAGLGRKFVQSTVVVPAPASRQLPAMSGAGNTAADFDA